LEARRLNLKEGKMTGENKIVETPRSSAQASSQVPATPEAALAIIGEIFAGNLAKLKTALAAEGAALDAVLKGKDTLFLKSEYKKIIRVASAQEGLQKKADALEAYLTNACLSLVRLFNPSEPGESPDYEQIVRKIEELQQTLPKAGKLQVKARSDITAVPRPAAAAQKNVSVGEAALSRGGRTASVAATPLSHDSKSSKQAASSIAPPGTPVTSSRAGAGFETTADGTRIPTVITSSTNVTNAGRPGRSQPPPLPVSLATEGNKMPEKPVDHSIYPPGSSTTAPLHARRSVSFSAGSSPAFRSGRTPPLSSLRRRLPPSAPPKAASLPSTPVSKPTQGMAKEPTAEQPPLSAFPTTPEITAFAEIPVKIAHNSGGSASMQPPSSPPATPKKRVLPPPLPAQLSQNNHTGNASASNISQRSPPPRPERPPRTSLSGFFAINASNTSPAGRPPTHPKEKSILEAVSSFSLERKAAALTQQPTAGLPIALTAGADASAMPAIAASVALPTDRRDNAPAKTAVLSKVPASPQRQAPKRPTPLENKDPAPRSNATPAAGTSVALSFMQEDQRARAASAVITSNDPAVSPDDYSVTNDGPIG